MKRKKLNVIIQAIACGTITLNLTPHLHGQQFEGAFEDMAGQVLDPYTPVQTPGVTEIEIPGSAYYVGPDGQRLTDLQLFQDNGASGVQQAPGQVGGETILSEEPIYDGKTVYPMGTFPSGAFGERIISETTVDENGKTIEVPGTLESGASMADGAGMENGIPADQVVQPNLDDIATDEVQPPVPDGGNEEPKSSYDVAPGDSVVAANGAELENLKSQLEKLNTRHDRMKDRLSEANRSIEKLTQEKQKAEKVAKESAASMGEILAGIEARGKKAKETSDEKTKAEALAKTRSEARENALRKELAETKKQIASLATANKKLGGREDVLKKELAESKQLLESANKKLAQPKTADKATLEKLAALMTSKEKSDAGLAKLKKDSDESSSKLKKQIRELKSQLKRAESKVKDKNEKSAKAVKDMEKDLESAKSKKEKAEKALAEAKKDAGEAEKELASKVKSMDSKLKKMESSINDKLAAKDKMIAEKENAISEKEKAIGDKEKMVGEKVKELEQKEQKISALMKKLDLSGKEFESAEKEMASKLKASETKMKALEKEMEQRVVSAKEKAANLKSELEKATNEATAAKKAADEAKAAMAKLQEGSELLKAKLADQTEALAMVESKLLQKENAEMKTEDPSGATGIAATPDPSPEPAIGSATKIEVSSEDDKAETERAKRDAAMAEVERKLADREAELKKQQAEKEAEMKAAAEKEAEMKAVAEKEAEMKAAEEKEAKLKAAAEQEAKMKELQAAKEAKMKAAAEAEAARIEALKKQKAAAALNSPSSLSDLEDQIQILKNRRDSLIVQAEKKIREKQEAKIDKMIADGEAADSDEVTAALDELNNSIHSSNEKLTARYRRKIEKLKKAFKAKLEKANGTNK